jgi:IS5 family transposase
MKPRPRSETSQFDQLLNLSHPLCLLARKIDWQRFDVAFAGCYCPDIRAPGKDIRLLVGLHNHKHTFNESDESLLDRWVENPYWQYFCGFETMQHDVPLHSTSLTKWRQRIGADRLVTLLEETVTIAVNDKCVTKKELVR